jgi:hypothetical protein
MDVLMGAQVVPDPGVEIEASQDYAFIPAWRIADDRIFVGAAHATSLRFALAFMIHIARAHTHLVWTSIAYLGNRPVAKGHVNVALMHRHVYLGLAKALPRLWHSKQTLLMYSAICQLMSSFLRFCGSTDLIPFIEDYTAKFGGAFHSALEGLMRSEAHIMEFQRGGYLCGSIKDTPLKVDFDVQIGNLREGQRLASVVVGNITTWLNDVTNDFGASLGSPSDNIAKLEKLAHDLGRMMAK